MNTKPLFDSVINLWNMLSEEEQRQITENPSAIKRAAAELVQKAIENIYVISIDDKDIPKKFQPSIPKWRKLASELGYTGPIYWAVKQGYTLKGHAAKNPYVYNGLEHLKTWDFEDKPTEACGVFFIPRIVTGSKSKNADEQRQVITDLRTRLELPGHHLNSFGEVSLVAALILAHFKRVGERTPLQREWVRTETRYGSDYLLGLGYFDENGLHCYWWFGRRNDHAGVFPLGVELGL